MFIKLDVTPGSSGCEQPTQHPVTSTSEMAIFGDFGVFSKFRGWLLLGNLVSRLYECDKRAKVGEIGHHLKHPTNAAAEAKSVKGMLERHSVISQMSHA